MPQRFFETALSESLVGFFDNLDEDDRIIVEEKGYNPARKFRKPSGEEVFVSFDYKGEKVQVFNGQSWFAAADILIEDVLSADRKKENRVKTALTSKPDYVDLTVQQILVLLEDAINKGYFEIAKHLFSKIETVRDDLDLDSLVTLQKMFSYNDANILKIFSKTNRDELDRIFGLEIDHFTTKYEELVTAKMAEVPTISKDEMVALLIDGVRLLKKDQVQEIIEKIKEKYELDPEILRSLTAANYKSHLHLGNQTDYIRVQRELAVFLQEETRSYEALRRTAEVDPINRLRVAALASVTPKRYQALLGILSHYCGVSDAELGELAEYVDNPEKFAGIAFDHDASSYGRDLKPLRAFNRKVAVFLSKDGGEGWGKIDSFLRSEAKAKDLRRIIEKFRIADFRSQEEISTALEKIYSREYSDELIEEGFKNLKKILISARLQKKGLETSISDELAERFLDGSITIAALKSDTRLTALGISEDKIERIFTKFVALGSVQDLAQLKRRVSGNIVSQMQERFAQEIQFLDGIRIEKMEGDEVLYRGVDSGSGLTSDLVREQFDLPHIGRSVIDGVSQSELSYQILRERGGPINRASYATATTFSYALAGRYAGVAGKDVALDTEGWIYDIRPKKGRRAVNLHSLSDSYQEIDFEQLDTSEIYAVYKVKNVGAGAFEVEEVILNPNYKKRDIDSRHKRADFSVGQNVSFANGCKSNVTLLDEELARFERRQKLLYSARHAEFDGDHSHLLAGDVTRESIQVRRQRESVTYAELLRRERQWQQFRNSTERYKDSRAGGFVDNVWFHDGPREVSARWVDRANNFKVSINVEADDFERAAEILIKEGYFDYSGLPRCQQKIAFKRSRADLGGRLAIILYAEGEKTPEATAAWQERLAGIEKALYDAGIKPRPLVSRAGAAAGSVAADRKFPGSLYCYYKKDHRMFDPVWDWEHDNYFEGISIPLAETIEEKIKHLEIELLRARTLGEEREILRLEALLEAERSYLSVSKLGPEKTENIQGDVVGAEKTTVRVVILNPDEAEEVEVTTTRERASFLRANSLRRKVAATSRSIVTTSHCDILDSAALESAGVEAVVNAGNSILELGNYGVSGLSRAIHDDLGYEAEEGGDLVEVTPPGGVFCKDRKSKLAKWLVEDTDDSLLEEVEILVPAYNADGNPLLEARQYRNKEGRKVYLDSDRSDAKFTLRVTEFPYHKHKMVAIKVKKLKEDNIVVVDAYKEGRFSTHPTGEGRKKLAEKLIIHAIGPDCRRKEFRILDTDLPEVAARKVVARKAALQRVYELTLDKAFELGVRNISLPVLSVGVFQYPPEEAAEVIAEVLSSYEDRFGSIRICAIDPRNPTTRPEILDMIDANLDRLHEIDSAIVRGLRGETTVKASALRRSDSGDTEATEVLGEEGVSDVADTSAVADSVGITRVVAALDFFSGVSVIEDVIRKNPIEYGIGRGSTSYYAIQRTDLATRDSLSRAIDSGQIDINARDAKGCTLLHLAVRSGLAETAKMLLDKGVDKTVRNNEGLQAADIFPSRNRSYKLFYPEYAGLGDLLGVRKAETGVPRPPVPPVVSDRPRVIPQGDISRADVKPRVAVSQLPKPPVSPARPPVPPVVSDRPRVIPQGDISRADVKPRVAVPQPPKPPVSPARPPVPPVVSDRPRVIPQGDISRADVKPRVAVPQPPKPPVSPDQPPIPPVSPAQPPVSSVLSDVRRKGKTALIGFDEEEVSVGDYKVAVTRGHQATNLERLQQAIARSAARDDLEYANELNGLNASAVNFHDVCLHDTRSEENLYFGERFSFSVTDEMQAKNYHKAVEQCLDLADVDDIFSDSKQRIAVIVLAQMHGGISYPEEPEKFREDVSNIFGIDQDLPEFEMLLRDMRKFSTIFQRSSAMEGGLFSGNEEPEDFVGLRLKRLSPVSVMQIFGMDLFLETCEKLGGLEEVFPEVDQFTLQSLEDRRSSHLPKSPSASPSARISMTLGSVGREIGIGGRSSGG